MSKVDAQRAMREARYAQNRASGPTRREAAAAAGTPAAPAAAVPEATPITKPSTKPARAPKATPTAATPEGELCGHKSMNGRACTRPAGHSEKSHRYG
ncbi:hypothetical protein [uncultured Friedmanniella sp.]|uniref:hypothetical protein n=1 Tax=uncultured Friedmanniella sp. TaxID=335381 RepID=UPI0035C9E828